MEKLNILQTKDLNYSFGPNQVLKNINISLNKGEVISIVGPSGCGKTTLLRICAGLVKTANSAIINTFHSCSFAFQDARLLPWQTALDNIAFGLKAQGIGRDERQLKATAIAERFNLTMQDLKKFPQDLSGGMRQRVSFARALITQPDLLFLDEPFSALDIGLKRELQQILIEQVCQQRLSAFFITHDLMEAVLMSHRIYVISGSPGEVTQQFSIPLNQLKRDDEFVYQETAKLLNHPAIMRSFELVIRKEHACN
ncbi:ABC transporter ATP-binding protein [Aliikangiella maris]|uniref:ATP-binding cassette domain-containing protein n=2 Tax=Aliikangiella maris TaxID=3162458 RepID=A0ABV2BX01_9GAMM